MSDDNSQKSQQNAQDSQEQNDQRQYAVGIDLGTTHSVMASALINDEDAIPEIEPIPQLSSPGEVQAITQLPSFLYLAHSDELKEQELTLPWENPRPMELVGALARRLGTKSPLRMVSSAKSWLGHAGVDRKEAFLPQNPEVDDLPRVSPFEASRRYLEHLRQAWNHEYPDAPLEQQDVVVTIPASFDPAARDLTAEAAQSLGLQRLTLLEEPQAALYSWISNVGDDWRDALQVGDIVLVVDIGGGTTDLSLIAVSEDDGNLSLERLAVGDHILLGGDNMDLALAYRLNAKLAEQGKRLQNWQIQALTHACRDAKEQLLSQNDAETVPIVVPSRGSKLLGSTLRTELTREDVKQTLIEGFFPEITVEEHPQQQARGALTQMGLPYAQDAAVSRHLAAFLSKHAESLGHDGFIKPTAILFNGGVLKSDILSQRLMDIVNQWLVGAGAESARRLTGADLDLAVAHGAAHFARVREGKGVRIRGGIANAYYVGVESAMPAVPGMPPMIQALCVAPFGMEEGTSTEVPSFQVGLVVGEPVRFQFFGSNTRREDSVGLLLDDWDIEKLDVLPNIEALLSAEDRQAGDVVQVRLGSRVTEVGTLCLEAIAVDNEQRWKVEFDVRDA